MKHHVVNRKSRVDRLLLWQGAMAAQHVPQSDIVVHVAKDKDDFPTREDVCLAAIDDGFSGFFSYHLENKIDYIGYGMLIGSWSAMRMWRDIKDRGETAVAWLDDYALGVHYQTLENFVDELQPAPDIIQLCWHYRPDLFTPENNRLPWPVKLPKLKGRKLYRRNDVMVGCEGTADWALVLSPLGAQWLLEHMEVVPYFNTESLVAAMWAENQHRNTVYSMMANDPRVHGLLQMSGNKWVVGLGHLTDTASDLIGTHEGT